MLFFIRETLIINWGRSGSHQSLVKSSVETNGEHENGKETNGEHGNGTETNGKEKNGNGKEKNGKEKNGNGVESNGHGKKKIKIN